MEEEDVIKYWLYPTTTSQFCPSTTLAEICKTVAQFTEKWVWHSQEFSLQIVLDADYPHFSGSCHYGENVLDEWFIVSLIKTITSIHRNLVGRVIDSDGEILLIEAAENLPSWAGEPSVASGRVFLFEGMVHLIPVGETPDQLTPIPSVTPRPSVCAQVIGAYPNLTIANKKVQNAIESKLENMPNNVEFNHHVCTLPLTRVLANVLSRNGSMLSKLVKAVLERDKKDMRDARSMTIIKQENVQNYSVRFSKCLYAMLSSCKVRPTVSSKWIIEDNKEELLGYKLALGLEILLGRAKDFKSGKVRGKQWNNFLDKLKTTGYFNGELEGSIMYNQKLNCAKKFWANPDNDETDENIVDMVREAEHVDEVSYSGIISPPGVNQSEDWMEITPESLDKMLEAQFGVPSRNSGQNIPEEVSNFLNRMSDMTGIEHESGIKFEEGDVKKSINELMNNLSFDDNEDENTSDSESLLSLGEEDPVMMDYMQRLDEEVLNKKKDCKLSDDIDKPLDIDSSVLSNLLASYAAQSDVGGHGPTSSLLQSMRLNPGRPNQ